jgi:hypothetical protein
MKRGDRVAYSVKFLRSIAAYTGPMPFARGVITHVNGVIVTVKWDKNVEDLPSRVGVFNLILESRIHLQL